MVHVAHGDLELVVGFLAGDQQAFQHLGDVAHQRLEVGETLGRVLVHRDAEQRHQAQAQLARIHQRVVAADQAGFFQRAHATQAGRGGQADAVGQFLVAHAAIALQGGENGAIVAIKFHKLPSFSSSGNFLPN